MGFTRRTFDMDPDWRFHRVDKQEESVEDNRHSAVYNASKAGKATGPATAGAFDDGAWEAVNLPHDYLREAEFSPDAIGNHGYRVFSDGWYRKTFSLDPSLRGSHVMLVFEGISTSSVIYLNGSPGQPNRSSNGSLFPSAPTSSLSTADKKRDCERKVYYR